MIGKTTLAAAALLLALTALASPAQAGPFTPLGDKVWDIGDGVVECTSAGDCIDKDPCHKEGIGNVCRLYLHLPQWCDEDSNCSARDPSNDVDGDLVPDSVEDNVCGREAGRAVADQNANTQCRSHTDMAGFPDTDGDGLPDGVESTVCFVENDNTDLDGSCNGNDWSF